MAAKTDSRDGPAVGILPILLLLARPAAGKSEIIAYLEALSDEERRRRLHLGSLCIIDDFPMLWAWFEEDHILEQMGKPRMHTTAEGFFSDHYLWDLLMERICLEYSKLQRDLTGTETVVIEFSRGSEHGGYTRAFEHLSREIAEACAALYVDVTYEESLRKNRRRYNPGRPDSILEHGLPDDKMGTLYRETDWSEVSGMDPAFLEIHSFRVPYVTFDNGDDVTTVGGEALGARLEETLTRLWDLRSAE